MKKVWIVLGVILLTQTTSMAQEYSIIAKAGISDYASYEFSRIFDSSKRERYGDGAGGLGPILSLGVRLRMREEFAVDGLVEYSTHQYQRQLSENPTVSDPDNSILDVNLLGRLGAEISVDVRFELLVGIGIYSQHNDEYIRSADDILPSEEYTGFGGTAGIGMEMIVSKRVNLAMEGMWRVRRHTTLTLQLGIVFRMGDRSGE